MPVFAHVDINNCYVSCEVLFRPALKGRVIVVLSNNDGCVIARSNEAKAIGIKMADAEFMVREILETHRAVMFSSNYALYGDMSARVMNNLARYTYLLMVYSIDEAFLALGNVFGLDLDAHAQTISENILRDTGLPITVGIGQTMSLAKLANKSAKKRSLRWLVLQNQEQVKDAVQDFPIADVWGVGHAYYGKLKEMNIKTALDFMCLKADWVRQHMTVVGLRLWKELWGEPCNVIKDIADRSKGLECSMSFNDYLTDPALIEEAVVSHTTELSHKLRLQKSMALNLTVYLRTNKHNIKHDQHYPSITVKVPFATNNTLDLVKVALQGLRAIWEPGYKYLKTGVRVTGIVPAGEIQLNVFSNYTSEKQQDLSALMDTINSRYGKGAVRVAAEGYAKKWYMKQDHLSRQYTTNWKDIIVTR